MADEKYRIEGDTLIINEGAKEIDASDFHFNVPLSENLFGWRLKKELEGIRKIIIPDGITYIDDYAFSEFANLTDISIPDSVNMMGVYVFDGCCNLKEINIPDNITHIEEGTFFHCTSLKNLTIPNDTLCIDTVAFDGCENLTNINVGKNNVEFLSIDGVLYNKDQTELLRCPQAKISVTIPDTVEHICDYAFQWCKSLESITIPSGVTLIEDNTFEGCESLINVTIPDGVTDICNYAFGYCKNLKSITIPDSVEWISGCAFKDCENLTIKCNKDSYAEKYAKENNIPCSYIEQDKKNENKQQTVIKETERTPAKPIKNGDIVQLTNFNNLYGMVSGMNEDHIFVLDCNGNERRVKRSEESVLKPVKSSPAIKKAFCEMLDQIEMRQQIRDDIYNLEEQESECDSKIADNATLLYSLLSGKGKNNRDIER